MLAHRVMMGSGAGDPYWNNVVALLHFDGADASTTFTDVKGHTFTANGNAQIDIAQSLFGGASGLFDGSGDYISTPNSADFNFGTGDFEVEVAVRFNALPVNTAAVIFSTYDGGAGSWAVEYRNDGGLGNRFCFQIGTTQYNFAWTPSINTWYRTAVSRSGTALRAFINGTQIGSTLTDSSNIGNTAPLWIGALNSGGAAFFFNGWLDECRITKGVAPHTANYTPDTAPFPDQ